MTEPIEQGPGGARDVGLDLGVEVGVGARTETAAAPPVADDVLPGSGDGARRVTGPNGGGSGWAPEPPSPKHGRAWWALALEWVGFGLAALLIAFVIKTFVFQAFYIPSESMVPTLEVGDRVLVNKISYKLHDVHRGDIVVFEAPEGTRTEEIQDLVKRVVGLPGDTIEGRDGRIYINGRLLAEPYLPAGTTSRRFTCTDQLGCTNGRIPAGHYFVLGDNRLQSKDSTYFGAIKGSGVIGRVFVRIWPLDRIAFIGPSYLIPIIIGVLVVALVFGAFGLVNRRRARAQSPRGP